MAKYNFVLAILAGVILVGCQFLQRSSAPVPAAVVAPPKPVEVYDPTPLPRGTSGRLAYLGSDGNVYVTTADGRSTIAVTDDATTAPEHSGFSYHRVSWSPEGHLAFASVERSDNSAPSQLYVTSAPEEPAQLVGRSDEHFVIYIYWSPVACPEQPGCQRLAYLIEEEDSIGLRMVDLKPDRVENRRAGLGQPFYFSWTADGRQMVWHTGGNHRLNQDARLRLYDLERDLVETLPHRPGPFHAPAWSPQTLDWLAVSTQGELDHLQNFKPDPTQTLTSDSEKQMAFAWSPDGDRIAYAVAVDNDDLIYGPVHIFDLETGQSRQIARRTFRTVGFFWSPNGEQLAYLKEGFPGSSWWQWRVYDLVEEEDRGFEAFTPSAQMQYMISSFNQYAQSHRFWSPDSRYLVYADRDPSLVDRVWLIDTWASKWAEPVFIAEGTMGVWSWD